MGRHSVWWVTCPHCAPDDRSCCQCHGTRRVDYLKAEQSVSWIWDFPDCVCAACVRLKGVRDALTPR